MKASKDIRAGLVGIVFLSFIMGYAANIYRYFYTERLLGIYGETVIPLDSKKIIKALETPSLSERQHRFLVSVVEGGGKSQAAWRNLLLIDAKSSQDYYLSEALWWATTALFFSLLIRIDKKWHLAHNQA